MLGSEHLEGDFIVFLDFHSYQRVTKPLPSLPRASSPVNLTLTLLSSPDLSELPLYSVIP